MIKKKISFAQIKDTAQKSINLFEWVLHFCRYGTFKVPKSDVFRKRIFILGNGPSLNDDIRPHISALRHEDVLMVNQAFTTDLAVQIKPKYACFMDPSYWCFEDSNPYSTSFKLANSLLEEALNQINWDLTIFVPNQFYKKRNHNGIHIKNSKICIQPFNASELYTFKKIEKFFYEKGLAIPSGINVLIASICCAISMRYSNIYLLGADSDWHKQIRIDNSSNRLFCIDTHYYEQNPRPTLIHEPIHQVFFCLYHAFKAYNELGELGFPILNLSSNSMIASFPRDTLENILRKG